MGHIKKFAACLSILLFYSCFCAYAQNSNDPSGNIRVLSSQEIEVLNQKALAELNGLTKIYGYRLKDDICGKTISKNPDQKISFEKLDGLTLNFLLTPEDISKNLIAAFELFPQGWILNIHIIFNKEDIPLSNNLKKDKLIAGLAENDLEENKFIISIYPCAMANANSTRLDVTLSHEIAHTNDWRNNPTMAIWEKVEFFNSVAKRYNSDDRYKGADDYISNIKFDSDQKTAYSKIKEYWAVIASVYLSIKSKDLSAEDQALVKSILERTNPGFTNVDQKASLRQGLFMNILAKPKSANYMGILIIRDENYTIYMIKGGEIIKPTQPK